jgi:gluconokinase
MQHIIAIDIGTTNCKAVTVTTEGRVFHSCKTGYPLIQETEGQSEQDPEIIFQAVLSMLQQSLAANAQHTVLAISFSAAMHSVIAMDKNGQPLTHSITWADTRSKPYADALLQLPEAGDIFRHTGTPIHPMSPLSKLVWLREERPAIFRQAHKFISIKEYIFFRLSGLYVVDHSIASATGLFDQLRLQWYQPALQAAGIGNEQLSQPVPVTYRLTAIRPAYGSLLGKIPVIAGGSDGCLANLGCGAVHEGEAAVTIGTSGAARVISNQPLPDEQRQLFRYLLTDRLFVTGGPTNNGGLALQWLAEQVWQHASLEEVISQAATVPAGADKLLFLPYLQGERAPIWDAGAKGAFIGLHNRHRQAHLTRAVMEGILFALQHVLQSIEAIHVPVHCIYASGGFTQSAFWLQLLADISGKKIWLTEGADASAIGAAFIALYALQLIDDPLAVKHLLHHSSSTAPNQAQHAVYREYFRLYRSLYPVLKDTFVQLDQLGR